MATELQISVITTKILVSVVSTSSDLSPEKKSGKGFQ